MARKPTVYDVAEAAGVSIATVSFAFTRPERVKAKTLESVLAAADALGYVPSASARNLAKGRTGVIGLYAFDYLLDPVADDAEPPSGPGRLFPLYADEVQRGVELECRNHGYALMVGGHRKAPHVPNIIDIAGRVDALIAFAGAVPAQALSQVAAQIPVVELGGELRDPRAFTVHVDNRGGMVQLTKHLLEAHAYRRFAYIGEQRTPEFRARYDGFSECLREAGLPVPGIREAHAGNDRSAAAAVASIRAAGPLPDVIVCDSDQTALAALDALRAAGLSAPSDVALAGFDGIIAGRCSVPRLTTVLQPMEQIGREAVGILLDALGDDDALRPSKTLGTELLLGESCGQH